MHSPFSKHIGIIALALALLAWGGYGYLSVAMQRRVENVNQTSAQLSQALVREASHKSIRIAARDIETLQEQIDGYFIPADGEVAFIKYIEALGKETGVTVTIKSVDIKRPEAATQTGSPAPATAEKPITEDFAMLIIVEGQWRKVFHLLTLLETMPFAAVFERVDLKQGSVVDKKQMWVGDIGFRVKKLVKS